MSAASTVRGTKQMLKKYFEIFRSERCINAYRCIFVIIFDLRTKIGLIFLGNLVFDYWSVTIKRDIEKNWANQSLILLIRTVNSQIPLMLLEDKEISTIKLK